MNVLETVCKEDLYTAITAKAMKITRWQGEKPIPDLKATYSLGMRAPAEYMLFGFISHHLDVADIMTGGPVRNATREVPKKGGKPYM